MYGVKNVSLFQWVRYCVPISHECSSFRLVACLPPAPRAFSQTVSVSSGALARRVLQRTLPVKPAPTIKIDMLDGVTWLPAGEVEFYVKYVFK